MIVGILHHGLVVSDLEASVRWYREALGLELVHTQRQENAYTPVLVGVPGAVLEVAQLRVPGGSGSASTHDVELIQYVDAAAPAAAPSADAPSADAPPPVNRVGAAHLAFLVRDLDALVARLLEHGAVFRNPPVDVTAGANVGARACYLHDPDGNTLELLQRAEATRG